MTHAAHSSLLLGTIGPSAAAESRVKSRSESAHHSSIAPSLRVFGRRRTMYPASTSLHRSQVQETTCPCGPFAPPSLSADDRDHLGAISREPCDDGADR